MHHRVLFSKFKLFFNFYEIWFYQYMTIPIFIFPGFTIWYEWKKKKEVFLVENYGNVSSIKYRPYDYPLKRLQLIDYRIKFLPKLFTKFIDRKPISFTINKTFPSFFFDIMFFFVPKLPNFWYRLFWPVILILFFRPFIFLEIFFVKVLNFFLYIKLMLEMEFFNYLYNYILLNLLQSSIKVFYFYFYKVASFLKLIFCFFIECAKNLFSRIFSWLLIFIYLLIDFSKFYYFYLIMIFSLDVFFTWIRIFITFFLMWWAKKFIFLIELLNPNNLFKFWMFDFNFYVVSIEKYFGIKFDYYKWAFIFLFGWFW